MGERDVPLKVLALKGSQNLRSATKPSVRRSLQTSPDTTKPISTVFEVIFSKLYYLCLGGFLSLKGDSSPALNPEQ